MKNGNSSDFLLALTFPLSTHLDPDVCRLFPGGRRRGCRQGTPFLGPGCL